MSAIRIEIYKILLGPKIKNVITLKNQSNRKNSFLHMRNNLRDLRLDRILYLPTSRFSTHPVKKKILRYRKKVSCPANNPRNSRFRALQTTPEIHVLVSCKQPPKSTFSCPTNNRRKSTAIFDHFFVTLQKLFPTLHNFFYQGGILIILVSVPNH